MEVIDHQVFFGTVAVERVDQGGTNGLAPAVVLAVKQQQVILEREPHLLQCADQPGTENLRCIVLGIERQPGHCRPGLEQLQPPLRHQGGFAETGAAGDHYHGVVACLVQAGDQCLARHGLGGYPWRCKFGGNEQGSRFHGAFDFMGGPDGGQSPPHGRGRSFAGIALICLPRL
ncbi:hypothetical protein D3C86_1722330 [compost metagenome]